MHRPSRNHFSLCGSVLVIAALLALWAQSQTPQSNSSQRQPAEQSRKEQRAKIGVALEGGGALGLAHIGLPQFYLGGAGRLSAYGTNDLFGNQYDEFRIGYLHNLVTLPPFVGRRVYAIDAYEFGKMYGASNESGFPNDFAAGVLAETVVGPLFLGGSVGDTGHDKWFFQLGHVF